MRTRLAVVVFTGVALLGVTGCTGDTDEQPIDVAEDRLSAAISDGTLVAGFTISTSSLDVVLGSPPRQEQLHPEPSEDRSPVETPAYPQTVRGSDFPLTASVQRARALLGECDDWGSVEVQALSPGIVATTARCSPGNPPSQVLLDDAPLPGIDEPFSAEAISTLWAEIEASGLGDELHTIRVDRAGDSLQVQFHGTSPLRTYQWNRGLTEPDSTVFSHPFAPEPHTLTLDQIPATEVAGSYDDAVSSLDNPNEAEILVVDIDPETGAPRLVLESADSTELVRLPLSD